MQPDAVEFPPFRLDLVNQELWRGAERLPLRGKPYAVLAYLVTHPARLVLRQELVEAVWQDTHVADGVLRGYVRDLRAVLGDDPAAPRFIETISRRGYRFVAPLHGPGVADSETRGAGSGVEPGTPHMVGRKTELQELERRFAAAVAGTRQVVFVTGEPGIGKTTLVDAFSGALASRRVRIARGQCLEHFGAGEAYLPLLEALGGLCRRPDAQETIGVLARHAPIWLAEMPALVTDAELETVHRRVQGATRERMLRELAEALEVLSASEPLVLVLEDLHWSDHSTLDLLSWLARRREPARLLVLATHRSQEPVGDTHPLVTIQQELQVHGLCTELALPPLDADEVAEVLVTRFPRDPLAPHVGRSIHQATEGNPLFVVTLADSWLADLADAGADGLRSGSTPLPDTLRWMIGRELERMPAGTRRILEAASAVGAEFSAGSVAAALEEAEEPIDERCAELARHGLFLQSRGAATGVCDTATGRYAFVHALHRQVLYEGLASARRARLHQRIGAWQERACGALVNERAAELAVHFEKGRDPERALHHLEVAARNAMRRHAHPEAAALLTRALALHSGLPREGDHGKRELSMQMALGTALLTTRGYAAPEVQRAFSRARELCRTLEEGRELAFAFAGLFRFFFVRAELALARELGEQVLRLAETRDHSLLAVGHGLVGLPLLSLADLAAARGHLERGIAHYDFDTHRALGSEHGDDPGLTLLAFLAIALWLLGHPDQALARIREADALAERLALPYGIAFAHSFAAWIHVRRGEPAAAQARCDALLRVASDHGFAFFLAEGAIFRGWALVQQGQVEPGLRQMREGLAAHHLTGARMGRPSHLALLADSFARAHRREEGLATVAEALELVEATGERAFEAELHRLQGELLGQGAPGDDGETRRRAEACVQRAIAVARLQQARSLELRAVLSLVRLEGARRRDTRARRQLKELAASFTEGFDGADLCAAAHLVAETPHQGR